MQKRVSVVWDTITHAAARPPGDDKGNTRTLRNVTEEDIPGRAWGPSAGSSLPDVRGKQERAGGSSQGSKRLGLVS